ncbi:MAG TPA: penicillin-binding protein 2 [Rhizorhapis sp.]|nr:penicillin-binding protein 2 [Rhizorhapis sp.]
MAQPIRIAGSGKNVTEASQSFTFTRRAMVLGGIQGGIGVLLAARMGWISIAENEHYELLSESNRVNLTLIPPRRGWIIDRHGKPLANNRTDFRVDIIPDRLHDKDATVASLAELLSLDPDEVQRIKDDLKKAAGFQPVQVADKLDYAQYAAVSVRLPELPGVAPARGFSRNYPAGAAVGHLIGYVGAASAEDYEENKDPLLITPGFKIGKDGLEKAFDKVLTGKPGAKRVEVTARGKVVRELTTRPDTPGHVVRLTIDAGLQHYAARRLGAESGSVVVMDCLTGDVLTLASMPSYDPNSFSDGIGHLEWNMLAEDDHVPLRNKTLQGLYPPGSTVKPMVALSFLEAGLDPNATVNCSGAIRVGTGLFHCWKRGGHGTVNMAKGIYQSCDVYFYHFAQQIGMQQIAGMARRLGLGQKFPLPFPSQSYGTVPDPDWKMKKFGKPWERYDTVNATIGQGYMLANPTQLAVMAARIASGRDLLPRFVMARNQPQPRSLGLDPRHLTYVRNAMSDVVNGPGTAGRARLPIPDVLLAGKTGTAQVRRITMAERRGGVLSNASLPWKFRDHGLFVCFAPFDRPRYAAAVVIEHGGGSGAAYPIARDVLTYLYDKEKAMAALEPLETAWGGTIEQRMAAAMQRYKEKVALEEAVRRGEIALPPENAMSSAGAE